MLSTLAFTLKINELAVVTVVAGVIWSPRLKLYTLPVFVTVGVITVPEYGLVKPDPEVTT